MTKQSPTRKVTTARTAVSLLCLALFLFLEAAASIPELHRCLHHDADHADHHCAVTLLSHGKLHTSIEPLISAELPVSFVFLIPLSHDTVLTAVDYQLLPGRAPPASLLG